MFIVDQLFVRFGVVDGGVLRGPSTILFDSCVLYSSESDKSQLVVVCAAAFISRVFCVTLEGTGVGCIDEACLEDSDAR